MCKNGVALTLFSECLAHEKSPEFYGAPRSPTPTSGHFLFCYDPGSGSVTQGHRENWKKSMCISFEEECIAGFEFLYKMQKFDLGYG